MTLLQLDEGLQISAGAIVLEANAAEIGLQVHFETLIGGGFNDSGVSSAWILFVWNAPDEMYTSAEQCHIEQSTLYMLDSNALHNTRILCNTIFCFPCWGNRMLQN